MKKTVIGLCLLLTLMGSASAAVGPVRLKSPRTVEPSRSFARVQGPERSAALSAGRPGKLLMLDAWITSNYLPDDSTTAIVWYNVETLAIIGSFYSQSSANVTATVDVMSDAGAPVLTQSFTGAPYPAHTNVTSISLGVLPTGYYRVRFRLKQGTATVGQQFWINVDAAQQ